MEILFTFSGSNQAIHAEQMLLKEEIAVKVMPLPSVIRAGCGFCLRVAPEEAHKAEAILREKKIPVGQMYVREVKNGKSRYKLYGGGDDGQV